MWANRRRLLLYTEILLLLLSTACVIAVERELTYPLHGRLPRSDIVFMPEADPVYVEEDTKTLGFINADGSNRQEYTFNILRGSPSMFGFRFATTYVAYPRWSMTGDALAFSIRDSGPNMRLIDAEGKMYGRHCGDINGGAPTFDLEGNIWVKVSKEDRIYDVFKELADKTLIARYDLKSCQLVSVFPLPVPFGSSVGEITESSAGWLSAAFYDFEADQDLILLYNKVTGEVQIFPGYHPSLTEDGTLLAYYSKTAALVVRDMQTGRERVLVRLFPASEPYQAQYLSMPGWAPDREWLVYNTPRGEIFKINIITGENIYLTYGWAPDWR